MGVVGLMAWVWVWGWSRGEEWEWTCRVSYQKQSQNGNGHTECPSQCQNGNGYSNGHVNGNGNDNDVLLVDIGGNRGHTLANFLSRWPNTAGRLIPQDLQIVLDDIKDLNPSIEAMVHDLFTEQPVKG